MLANGGGPFGSLQATVSDGFLNSRRACALRDGHRQPRQGKRV